MDGYETRQRVLIGTAIAGGAMGVAFSPHYADQPGLMLLGFMAMTGALGWMKGEGIVDAEMAREEALDALVTEVQAQRDELAQLVDAIRADVGDLLADRGDHDDCPIRDALTVLVDDGPLSIDAHNRARAGLAPAEVHEEG